MAPGGIPVIDPINNIEMTSGYSGRPLYKKLNMKEGSIWQIVNMPRGYKSWLGDYGDIQFVEHGDNLDGVHAFARTTKEVEDILLKYRDRIDKHGMIWVSWYKKSSGVVTDVSEDVIRNTALALGLVDIKVCSVTKEWSALKIVWRRENR